MKKTLIALAVLASSGAAMAQSTFTLYGIADANLERQKGGANSINQLSSGGWNGSRWGLRGSEDLGGGLKAVFTLESGFAIDNGTLQQGYSGTTATPAATAPTSVAGSSRLFGRQAFVGIESGAGTVTLGRQYTPIGNIADLYGTKNTDVMPVLGVLAAGTAYRADNAINYKSPEFSGFSAEAQYSLGLNGEVAGAKSGRLFSLGGKYLNGPITAGVGVIQITDLNYALPGDQKRNEFLAVGGYDFGIAKVLAHYSQTEVGTAAVKAPSKMKVFGANAAFPFGAFTVKPGFAIAKDVNGDNSGAAANKDDAKLFTLQSTYDLSKRTALYNNITIVSNDRASAKGFNGPAADKNSNDIQVGIRHRF